LVRLGAGEQRNILKIDHSLMSQTNGQMARFPLNYHDNRPIFRFKLSRLSQQISTLD